MNTSNTTEINKDFDFTVDDEYKRKRKADNNLHYNEQHREENNERERLRRETEGDKINEKRRENYEDSGEKKNRQISYALNSKEKLAQQKEYRKKLGPEYNEKQKKTIDCICGSTHQKKERLKHRRTDKHKDFIIDNHNMQQNGLRIHIFILYK